MKWLRVLVVSALLLNLCSCCGSKTGAATRGKSSAQASSSSSKSHSSTPQSGASTDSDSDDDEMPVAIDVEELNGMDFVKMAEGYAGKPITVDLDAMRVLKKMNFTFQQHTPVPSKKAAKLILAEISSRGFSVDDSPDGVLIKRGRKSQLLFIKFMQ